MSSVRCSRCRELVPRDEYAAHIPCPGPQGTTTVAPGEPLGWGSLIMGPGHLQRSLPGIEPEPPTAPHVPGSDTSRAAAQSMRPHLQGLQAEVYRRVEQAGPDGCTCDELEVAMQGKHQTISARVRELVQAGHIVDSGHRRRTRSGRTARVYCASSP